MWVLCTEPFFKGRQILRPPQALTGININISVSYRQLLFTYDINYFKIYLP